MNSAFDGAFSKVADVRNAKTTQLIARLSGVSPLVLQRVRDEGLNNNKNEYACSTLESKPKTPPLSYLETPI